MKKYIHKSRFSQVKPNVRVHNINNEKEFLTISAVVDAVDALKVRQEADADLSKSTATELQTSILSLMKAQESLIATLVQDRHERQEALTQEREANQIAMTREREASQEAIKMLSEALGASDIKRSEEIAELRTSIIDIIDKKEETVAEGFNVLCAGVNGMTDTIGTAIQAIQVGLSSLPEALPILKTFSNVSIPQIRNLSGNIEASNDQAHGLFEAVSEQVRKAEKLTGELNGKIEIGVATLRSSEQNIRESASKLENAGNAVNRVIEKQIGAVQENVERAVNNAMKPQLSELQKNTQASITSMISLESYMTQIKVVGDAVINAQDSINTVREDMGGLSQELKTTKLHTAAMSKGIEEIGNQLTEIATPKLTPAKPEEI